MKKNEENNTLSEGEHHF